MSLRNEITEDEYDRLSDNAQRHYIYCPLCGHYFLKNVFFYHPCKP